MYSGHRLSDASTDASASSYSTSNNTNMNLSRSMSASQLQIQEPFLEPPHTHDLESVSQIATLPLGVVCQLPLDHLHGVLFELQESTSVTWASYERLADLLEERFERCILNYEACWDGEDDNDVEPIFSESSFFNHRNQYLAEREYLFDEAYPDWKHKAALTRSLLKPYMDLSLVTPESPVPATGPKTIAEWFRILRTTVESWTDHARRFHTLDFDDVVDDYLRMKRQKSMAAMDDDTVESSPIETPMVENDLESAMLQIGLDGLAGLEMPDSMAQAPVKVVQPISPGLNLPSNPTWNSGIGIGVSEAIRKDSGVVMELDVDSTAA